VGGGGRQQSLIVYSLRFQFKGDYFLYSHSGDKFYEIQNANLEFILYMQCTLTAEAGRNISVHKEVTESGKSYCAFLVRSNEGGIDFKFVLSLFSTCIKAKQ
jgi:hypothetical protein